MGKSPGKWIKTVLFGKKASKSNLSKGRDALRSANEKEAQVAGEGPATEFSSGLSISQPVAITNDQSLGRSELEQVTASHAPCNVLVPLNQDADGQGSILSEAPDDPDRIRVEKAATKAQAAFRGYLARRAFWALKGIIRLQALVRGHLVRRQAVSTLRCIGGIVKLQAYVRGQKISFHYSVAKGHRKCYIGKLQIIGSSTTTIPLRLQYDPVDSNSAWSWLERWTNSRIWESFLQTRKAVPSKPQEKQENSQRIEIETGRSKRSVRRVPAANLDNFSASSVTESEKPKRSMRRIWSNPADSMQEPQNELEKVKRNLRKVSTTVMETADQVEVRPEKPHHNLTGASGTPAPDVLDQGIGEPAEQPKTHPFSTSASKHPDIESSTSKAIAQEEVVHVLLDDHALHDDQSVVGVSTLGTSDKNDIMHEVDEVSKENQTSNVNQKTSCKKVSTPVKQQEYPENGVQHTPKLPSYMAATESAKAKLRGHCSPRSGPVTEQNGLTRRHSLPAPANGKSNVYSPRTQRNSQNGKDVVKTDKSLLSSRDRNEKTEWRR